MTNFNKLFLILATAGLLIGMAGCSSNSSNPVAPGPYPTDWFPLTEGIATVWENVDYDSMGMAGMMYADTSIAEMRMRGGMMYYAYGVDLAERESSMEDSICLIMRNDSLFAHDFSAGASPMEVLEALFPPRTGVSWIGEWNAIPAKWSSVWQRVTVPAGTFSNVAVLQFGPMGADSSYKQFWFAQGVGVIQVKMWMDHMNGASHDVMPMHMMKMRKIIYP